MSGHSKWHNIQKTKGAADAKRSATFTKIAKEIIVAVKQGGSGDPANNSRLATVVAKAKAANMPNDNIKRTIDKALGSGNTDNYESVTYEGYGPCGVAVIVEALPDNRQRTAPEIRHYFDKFGKGMGAQGCVSWSFDRKGVIVISNEAEELDEDTDVYKRQPGIGKKIAQRIILELKDKLIKEQGGFEAGSGAAADTPAQNNKAGEAAAALAVLGYGSQEIAAALKGIDKDALPLEEIIRQSLKKMVK